MLHQPHADTVREQVTQQALEVARTAARPSPATAMPSSRRPGAELPPTMGAPAGPHPDGRDHPVLDQLADPHTASGTKRPHHPQTRIAPCSGGVSRRRA